MSKVNLYDQNGYLNIPKIKYMADRDRISFIVIIGSRQVGKTYGTLKLMTEQASGKYPKPFILMRRTQAETDFILHNALNPFAAIDPNITCKRASGYHGDIIRRGETAESDERIGIVLALTTVSKIRGFSGAVFTDLVYDEFIPERHVQRFRGEGDAFLNAVVTISGNRELEDRPPLRVWLLANANDFNSPVLSALNLTAKIESMKVHEQELSIMPDRGIMVVLPRSEQLIERRKQTAIAKATSERTTFARMAFDNDFAYNDSTGVRAINLRDYRYVCSVPERFAVYQHKGTGAVAVVDAVNVQPFCRNAAQFNRYCPWARQAFINDRIIFDSLRVRSDFEDFIL